MDHGQWTMDHGPWTWPQASRTADIPVGFLPGNTTLRGPADPGRLERRPPQRAVPKGRLPGALRDCTPSDCAVAGPPTFLSALCPRDATLAPERMRRPAVQRSRPAGAPAASACRAKGEATRRPARLYAIGLRYAGPPTFLSALCPRMQPSPERRDVRGPADAAGWCAGRHSVPCQKGRLPGALLDCTPSDCAMPDRRHSCRLFARGCNPRPGRTRRPRSSVCADVGIPTRPPSLVALSADTALENCTD